MADQVTSRTVGETFDSSELSVLRYAIAGQRCRRAKVMVPEMSINISTLLGLCRTRPHNARDLNKGKIPIIIFHHSDTFGPSLKFCRCVCAARVCVCVRACVRACVCVWMSVGMFV